MVIGLGTSGYRVIEHWHGIPFQPSLTRLREYVEIIRMILAGEPLKYSGKMFNLQRGFRLRFQPVRSRIPIFIASLTPKVWRKRRALPTAGCQSSSRCSTLDVRFKNFGSSCRRPDATRTVSSSVLRAVSLSRAMSTRRVRRVRRTPPFTLPTWGLLPRTAHPYGP